MTLFTGKKEEGKGGKIEGEREKWRERKEEGRGEEGRNEEITGGQSG